MAITDISNKIIDDAKKAAEWISEDTEKELKKIERETKKTIKNLRSEYEKKTTRMLQEQARMIESAAEHSSRLLINRKKRDILNSVFNDALRELVSLQGESYKAIVKSCLLQIPNGTKGVIVVADGRKKDMQELVAELGLDNPVETSSDIKGGFIFSGEHFNYNFSFEHLIKDKKADLEVQISSLLFE